jgi:phosphoglycerate dehydrogenase-like enzyme
LARQLNHTHPDVSVALCDTYDGLGKVIDSFRPDAVYSIRFDGTKGFPSGCLLGSGGPAWIAVGGSGVDHLGHWDKAKTTVTNAAGVAASMMAEYVLGCVLHFTLNVPGLQDDKGRRQWRSRKMSPLRGKTMLVIGLGHTGRMVARYASALGVQTIGTRAQPMATDHVDEVFGSDRLHSLLPRADIVVVCAPLLESTKGMLDGAAFELMKPGTILVDVSRGGIVDGACVLAALGSGQLTGAALDVFETEPLPGDNPLWGAPNLLISPHCSSVFDAWDTASMSLFCENVTRWRAGEPLRNIVDPDRGY